MATCWKCGVDNRDEAKFCSSCGTEMSDEIRVNIAPDNDNPFGLPDFGGRYPIIYTPTKVIPRRIHEKLTQGILARLLGPLLIAVVLTFLVIYSFFSK